jgi:hypothetical protein
MKFGQIKQVLILAEEIKRMMNPFSFFELPFIKKVGAGAIIQRQIEASDHQIDALVYELYGLTEEEIRIVEGGRSLVR